jgi:Mitochondrial K+-H+ exchange-related
MDVYLVPVTADRHELFCETRHDEGELQAPPSPHDSWWRRQVAKFRAAVAEAEQQHERENRGEVVERRGIGAWVMGRIAEAVAEQRLLWRLRNETAATLVHPDDIAGARALQLARAEMSADYRKHRNWSAIDGVLAIVVGLVFFLIPGPNVLGWYFLFRAIGHYFALKGARQGLDKVEWQTKTSSHLTAIRQALTGDPAACLATLDDIGAALGLERLSGFVNRVARGRRKKKG